MKRFLSLVFGLSLIISSLVFSVGLVVFDHSFYYGVYEELNLAEKENISTEDLHHSIDLMIDYVHGDRDDLNGTIHWKNGVQETFNEKEKSHMVDVKALWQNAEKTAWICVGLMILCALLLFWKAKRHALSFLASGILICYAAFAFILAFLGIWMAIDFTGLWVQFHHLFFSNQLWLLNPATDFMIVICPESLFYTMIVKIVLWFGGFSLLMVLISLYYLKKKAVIGYENLKA